MPHLHRRFFPAMAVAAGLCAGAARAEPAPTGVWIDDQGRGGIEITDCGGKLCGHLVWFKDMAEEKNCGKQIMGDVAPVGSNTWDNGWIYSPEKKQRFDVELKPIDGDKLQVMGYAGMKFLSKTMVWTRAPADLRRCETAKADAAPAAPPAKAEPSAPLPAPREATAPSTPADDEAVDDEAAEERSKRTARADPPPSDSARKPSRERRDDDGNDDGPVTRDGKGNCKLDVPYVTLTFPCKD